MVRAKGKPALSHMRRAQDPRRLQCLQGAKILELAPNLFATNKQKEQP